MEFLVAIVPLLATNLAQLCHELQSVYGLHELGKLQNSVSLIQAVLSDAQEKEQSRNAVNHLLNELSQAAYDANDILDEVATERQRCHLIKYALVRNFLAPINPKREMFKREVYLRMREIENRLDSIASRCPLSQLTQHSALLRQQSYQTTSQSPPQVLGRENDKQKIKDLLMPLTEATDSSISVIAILGMPGIGKTTLAQLVCNDDSVKNYFDLRLWVYVSYDFDLMRIMKIIIESIDGFQCDLVSLDNLQRELRKKLSGKRYLLVLDDVWQERCLEWETLKNFLYSGAQGSKIIVTTRIEAVAYFMATSAPYRLQGITDDDCWSLVRQYALTGDRNVSFDLVGYRMYAVNKCKGLPLAAITLGHMLFRETDRNKWGAILQSTAWEFPGADRNIMNAVSLSYQHLPQYLKPCFAYFSIIPKGYEFEKEFIIQLWIAQNFIRSQWREQMEDIGSDYFDSLMQSSFFQYSHYDHKSRRHRYIMHDVVHGFAQHIAAEECSVVEPGTDWYGSASVRHLCLYYEEFVKSVPLRSPSFRGKNNIYEEVYKCNGLHTLLLIGSSTSCPMAIPDDVAERLGRLRTLNLSNSGLTLLPESIGNLKHLRCLQLQNTNIIRLPESVTCLYNLQTLGLRNCYLLEELPKNIRNLQNLRHIDLHLDGNSRMTLAPEGTHARGVHIVGKLRRMPPDMGLLTYLRTLSRFIVSTRPHCGLSQLRDLNNLHGELLVERLDLVFSAAEAVEANLASKEHIDRLELTWNYSNLTEAVAQSVGYEEKERILKNLRPHTNLKELGIVGYDGTSLPTWTGEPSFSNLVTLWISKTYNCLKLPPLGQLPTLKYLYIKEMHGVKHLDCTFCGRNKIRFPSLEKLHLENMSGLEDWWGDDDCALPYLRELVIKDCAALDQLKHKLPSLTNLVIEASRNFAGLLDFPELKSLEVKTNDDWIWSSWSVVSLLPTLTFSGLQRRTFPINIQGCHALIRRLEISNCNQLLSIPDDWLPIGLLHFAIKHCPELHNLPKGLTKLTKLEDLEIENFMQLRYLPIGLRNMTSLARLEISDCPGLLCLPNDGFPSKLQFLSISNSPELRKQCLGMGDQGWFTLRHDLHVWIDGAMVTSSVHHYPYVPQAPRIPS
ncbi:hypothetical protein Cni_G15919 [Canna indica]|uniref:Uncharacterized protein n=1 Tax=Canna indica TaxID=4628 RepID=A0AAQ3KKA1_9LILI|nr:hypothetical protein Cni_G15919 [Canna indica]